MSNRIPPLLEPYLTLPPESSLILLTSTLGASTNWLVLRHIYSYLKSQASEVDVGVVLVSFMRDAAFWKEGAARLGLDLDATKRSGRFSFVDGLTGLVAGDAGGGRNRVIKSPKEVDVRREIEAAVADLKTTKNVLIIDQPDVLLAMSKDEDTTSGSLGDLLLSLRERVHATVLTLSADDPLLHTQNTTLEKEHAAFVLGQAHVADRALSLRMLDTGTARDVSGVVRITGEDGEGAKGNGEWLYFVGGDGSVKVFERGT